jgi:hypothetical protein
MLRKIFAGIFDLHGSYVAVGAKITVIQTRVRAHSMASNAKWNVLISLVDALVMAVLTQMVALNSTLFKCSNTLSTH